METHSTQSRFQLGDSYFYVARINKTQETTPIISHNYLNGTVLVSDLTEKARVKEYHEDEVEILHELLTFENDESICSFFFESMIQVDNLLYIIMGIINGDVVYECYATQEKGLKLQYQETIPLESFSKKIFEPGKGMKFFGVHRTVKQ